MMRPLTPAAEAARGYELRAQVMPASTNSEVVEAERVHVDVQPARSE